MQAAYELQQLQGTKSNLALIFLLARTKSDSTVLLARKIAISSERPVPLHMLKFCCFFTFSFVGKNVPCGNTFVVHQARPLGRGGVLREVEEVAVGFSSPPWGVVQREVEGVAVGVPALRATELEVLCLCHCTISYHQADMPGGTVY